MFLNGAGIGQEKLKAEGSLLVRPLSLPAVVALGTSGTTSVLLVPVVVAAAIRTKGTKSWASAFVVLLGS